MIDNIKVNFGSRIKIKKPRLIPEKRLTRNIISEAKRLFGKNCPKTLIGTTDLYDSVATVFINTEKSTIKVTPEHCKMRVLEKLSQYFRKHK